MSAIVNFFRTASRSTAAKSPAGIHYETVAGTDFLDENEKSHVLSIKAPRRVSFASCVIYLLLAALWSFSVFILGTKFPEAEACNRQTTTWSPAQNIIRFHDEKMAANFLQPSPYRGAGDDVDAAWDKVWQIGGVPVRVEESQLRILQKDPKRNWTRVPASRGGGIAGYPEVFHQLHCLNVVRMATYPEHYANHTIFVDHPETSRDHIDHCIEIMRLHLQCTAEMTTVLTEMLPGHKFPAPDFNVIRKCRNFSDLQVWMEENALHGVGGWDNVMHHHLGGDANISS